MPVIKSAIKKLRKDRKRTKVNRGRKEELKKRIKEALKSHSAAKIRLAASFADKMAKVHLIHKNKAARIKARLSKLAPQKPASPKGGSASLKKIKPRRKKKA